MRFSVNQGFIADDPKMSSLILNSARTKVVSIFSHPLALMVDCALYNEDRIGRISQRRTWSYRGHEAVGSDRPACVTLVLDIYAQLVDTSLFSDLNSYQSWFDQKFIATGKTR